MTFEGIDGAGKSTQIRLLGERLRGLGLPIVLTREPGGAPGAEAVRGLLLDAPAGQWDAISEALLFYAARREHAAKLIRPAMGRGDWVLCDRFTDSSHAYQGRAEEVPEAFLDTLDQNVLDGLKPDLTLILDLPAGAGLARVQGRGDRQRFEARGEPFQEKARLAFQAIARREPGRCRLIDATPPPGKVARAIWNAVSPLVEARMGPETRK